jgi:hypothetical protein
VTNGSLRRLLGTLNIKVDAVKNDVGAILLIVNDTAHKLETATTLLPELSDKVTDMHKTMSGMADTLEKLLKLTVCPFSCFVPDYSRVSKCR